MIGRVGASLWLCISVISLYHVKKNSLLLKETEPVELNVDPDHQQMNLHFAAENPQALSHVDWNPLATDWNAAPQHMSEILEQVSYASTRNPASYIPSTKRRRVECSTKRRWTECESKSEIDSSCCRCSGGCRNSRCACVKEGRVCSGGNCKCTNCRNPFNAMQELGVHFPSFKGDECLIHNMSKIKNMRTHLMKEVTTPCCQKKLAVKDCLPGMNCPKCKVYYTYSWCSNKLCDSNRAPRNHCSICRRCGDYRDQHCESCGHCYFAGVTGALRCPCKQKQEDSSKMVVTMAAVELPTSSTVAPATANATSSKQVPHVRVKNTQPKASLQTHVSQAKVNDGAEECCIM
jgi:hypothetical protein